MLVNTGSSPFLASPARQDDLRLLPHSEGDSVETDGPQNFIDPAPHEGDSAAAPLDARPVKPSVEAEAELASWDEQLKRKERERWARRHKRHAEAAKAKREAKRAETEQGERGAAQAEEEAEKARHDARKARYEAEAKEWSEHAGKRFRIALLQSTIFLVILVLNALTGIGVVITGVIADSAQVLAAGALILSGTSASAIRGLTKTRPPDDENQDPPP
jgi:hypothetical protein